MGFRLCEMIPFLRCCFQPTEKHHRERHEQSSPLNGAVVSAASALNRLAANNGEITITTTHGPGGTGVKASPSSLHSPKDEDDDLLNDSPSKFFLFFVNFEYKIYSKTPGDKED